MKTFPSLFFLLVFFSCLTSPEKESHNSEDKIMDGVPAEGFNIRNIASDTAKQESRPLSDYLVETYPTESGWGYKILKDGKPVIDQPHIPAVSGLKSFSNADEAKKVGDLMAVKLARNIMPPTVSVAELDSMGISP